MFRVFIGLVICSVVVVYLYALVKLSLKSWRHKTHGHRWHIDTIQMLEPMDPLDHKAWNHARQIATNAICLDCGYVSLDFDEAYAFFREKFLVEKNETDHAQQILDNVRHTKVDRDKP